jgi:Spy/CpxP family protein refolding chaperone
VEIDATDAQRARLDPIVKQAAKDLLPMRERMRDARKQGLAVLTAASVDRNALESLRADQLQAADAASQRLVQALADVADVLTPEQRKNLAERLQRRRGWHHG